MALTLAISARWALPAGGILLGMVFLGKDIEFE